MSSRIRALAFAGLTALGGLSHVSAPATPRPDTLQGPGNAVPFVSQGPLLCGGAAAAMIQRFWGELGVYAEDCSGLVDPEAGGIYTDDLASALVRRGYTAEVIRDDPSAALARARAGIPVVTLLSSGRSRYHYVVVVATGAGQVRYHDPLRGPDRELTRPEFLRRWAASAYWALVAVHVAGTAGPGSNRSGRRFRTSCDRR